jgi:hypothetical protein
VVRTFVPQLAMSHPAEFVVDERDESIERLHIAGSPLGQQRGYQTRRRLRHNSHPAIGKAARTGKFSFLHTNLF